MVGQTISHYRILDNLGEGGMGVVYKAHDIKLDRTVALKFLPADSTAKEDDRARFLQEARAVAKLSHPNICGIHSIGEHEDRQFIDMELIEGSTLREKMENGESGDLDTVLDHAIQISDALSEAHEKNIIHRDIKPSNIMVDHKGRIKVMDFGLAKLKGKQNITKAGSTVGTRAYMSPEQIQGREIDHRSDLFSLGILLYELVTGVKPFSGEHEAATLYSIVNEEPTPVENHLPDASGDLIHILERALEKDPSDRYQSAQDLKTELQRLQRKTTSETIQVAPADNKPQIAPEEIGQEASTSGGSTSVTINIPDFTSWKSILAVAVCLTILVLAGYWWFSSRPAASPPSDQSIAVLPLENLSDDKNDSFTGGLHDDVIIQLSKIEDLKVIARSSVMEYPPGDRDLQQIGEELGVSSVLEGNVHRAGNTIRVSVQLIDTENRQTLWGEVYDRKLNDLFAIQSDIAGEIAGALQANITPEEQNQIDRFPTSDMEAYEFYLRGLEYFNRTGYQKENWETAIDLFNKAINLDPGLAHAYAYQSLSHSLMYWFAHDQTPERLEKARINAEKAISMQPDLPQSLMAMGNYYYRKRNYEEALRYISRASDYLPNDSGTRAIVAYIQRRMGQWESSVQNLKKAVELDPLNTDPPYQLALSYFFLRKFELAQKYLKKSLEIAPDFVEARYAISILPLDRKGDIQPLKEFLREYSEYRHEYPVYWIFGKLLLRDFHWILEFVNSWEKEIEENQNFMLPAALAKGIAYHYLGNPDQSVNHLKEARQILERQKKENPGDQRIRAALGLTYALLDLPESAAGEAEKAMDIMPVNEDALAGNNPVIYASQIYAHAGKPDRALELIERALRIPSMLTVERLKTNPLWDPLRDHSGYQKLLEKHK